MEVNKGNYQEAEKIRLKVLEAKNYFSNEKKTHFKHKQKKESESVQSEFNRVMNDFNLKWKKTFYEFETRNNLAIEKLLKKNQEEIKSLKETIDKDADNIKFSSYYEKLVDMETKLANKEKYLEAEKIRNRVLTVKENEIKKYLKDEVIKYNTHVSKLNKTHDLEMKDLKKRIEEERLNLERERVKELQEINFNYKSKKIEVDVKQRHDKKQFEDELKEEKTQMEKNLMMSEHLKSKEDSSYIANSNANNNHNSSYLEKTANLINSLEGQSKNNTFSQANPSEMNSNKNITNLKEKEKEKKGK